MAKNKNVFNLPRYRVNDEIRGYNELRIVGEGIESKITTMAEARQIAESMELDLIEINPTSNPPVVKIASYEKLMYELKKAAKKNKQSAKPLKEIQLSVNITEHDLQTKANNAKKFIENGSKVKVTLTMKGRELTRREDSKRSILEFIVMLEDVAVPETQPRDDGNKTIVILKKKG
jgi:translation initiation factor IF-3